MAGSNAAEAAPVGAIAVAARSLAPDLARGAMLLIALANACLYQYRSSGYGGGWWLGGHPMIDQVVLLIETVFVRDRAYPMYALLFGYGMVQLLRRHTRKGIDERGPAEVLLRRLTYRSSRSTAPQQVRVPAQREQLTGRSAPPAGYRDGVPSATESPG